MSIKAVRSYIAAGLVFVAGILWSVISGDWSWFSRSGAAVVAIGIVLTSHQIFEHNRMLDEYRRGREHKAGNGGASFLGHLRSRDDWAYEDSIRQLLRARHEEEELWRAEFSGFYMLVTGTLVWGFGDLLGKLFA
jgi:hypothetical protein